MRGRFIGRWTSGGSGASSRQVYLQAGRRERAWWAGLLAGGRVVAAVQGRVGGCHLQVYFYIAMHRLKCSHGIAYYELVRHRVTYINQAQ